MAVQYNSKDNTWSTWLDIFKKEIPEASEESINAFEKLAKAQAKGYDPTINGRMEKWIHQNKLADESLIKFLKDTNYRTKDLASYQQYLKDTGKATSSFANFTKKAGTVLKSFGATLGSMAVNWAISEAISAIATAIDNEANRVEYAQERLEEFNSTVSESKNKLEEQQKWIEENGSKYEELARGVDNYGHNVSLTADEFSEYQSITKDIADMFPNMISGYNDQNDAIIKTKGNVDALTESYKENVRQAYASTLAKSSETYNDYKDAISLSKNQKKYLTELISGKVQLKNIGVIESPLVNDGENGFQKEMVDGKYTNVVTGIDTDILSEEIIEEIKKETDGIVKTFDQLSPQLQQKIRAVLTTANSTITTETSKVKPVLEAFIYGEDGSSSGYGELSEDGKQAIRNVISSLDDTFYSQFNSDTEMASYFQSYFIEPLKDGLDDTDLAVKINTLFSVDKNNYSSYKEYVEDILNKINQLKAYTDKDGNPIYSNEQLEGLKRIFGVSDISSTGEVSGINLVNQTKEKYRNLKGADKYIDTLQEDEIRVLYKLEPDKAKSLDALKQAVSDIGKETEKEVNKSDNLSGKSFKQIWDSLGTGTDEASKKVAEEKENLLKLAEAGRLTEEAFKDSSIADTFTKAGYSISEATKKVNGFIENVKQLNSMKTGISAIISAYDEKKDASDKRVGADTLNSMYDTLGVKDWSKPDLKVWEQYKEVASSSKSTLKELKSAQDDLATSFVNSNNFLANITDGTKDYYVSLLREMGVTNAVEVATKALETKTKSLKETKDKLGISSKELKSINLEEADALDDLDLSADGAAKALYDYMIQKIQCGNIKLDTATECTNLYNLALKAGIAASKLRELLNAQIQYNTYERVSSNVKGLQDVINSADDENKEITFTTADGDVKKFKNKQSATNQLKGWGTVAKNAKSRAEKNVEKFNKKNKVNLGVDIQTQKGSGKDKKDKNSSSKDKSKSTQVIDWIERRLNRLNSTIDYTSAKLQNLFSIKAKSNNLNEQIKTSTKLINAYGIAATKYKAKANSVKLSGSLKKAVREGRLKGYSMKELIATYGEKTADKITKYQDYYDKYQDDLKNKQDEIAKRRQYKIDKEQNYVDKADAKYNKNEALKENAKSASEKNTILKAERENLKNSYKHQIKIAKINKDKVEQARLNAELQKKLNDIAIEQHQNIVDELDRNNEALEAQKQNLKTASEKNSIVEQQKAIAKQTYAEQIEIAKLQYGVGSDEVKKLQEEQKSKLADFENEKFENIQTEYSNWLDMIQSRIDGLDGSISIVEAKGITATKGLYQGKVAIEKENLSTLKAEKAALEEQHKSTEVGTALWYSQEKSLNDVSTAIINAQKNMIEYRNSIREANDKVLELKKSFIDLGNIYLDNFEKYLSRYALTDEDTGGLTDKGVATLGIYRKQSISAGEQQKIDMDKLNELEDIIARYNIYDDTQKKNLLEANNYDSFGQVKEDYEKYAQAVQDDISNRISAEENIINLMKERYNAELAYIQKLIEDRKTQLSQEKDLYDYQKSIQEKVDNISLIQKQLDALRADGSEEAMAKRNVLQEQLDDAKEDLMDVEYDKYISDQQNMLDKLSEDYQNLIEDLLQDVDALLNEGNEIAKNNGDKFEKAINGFTEKYGQTPFTQQQIDVAAIKTAVEKEQKDQDAANEVLSAIEKIGTVDLNGEGRGRLVNAENLYKSLTDTQRKIVDENPNGLTLLQKKQQEWVALQAQTQTSMPTSQPSSTPQQSATEAKRAEERRNQQKAQFEQLIKNTYWQNAKYGTNKLFKDNGKETDYTKVQKKIAKNYKRDDFKYVNADWIKEVCKRLGIAQSAGSLLNYMNGIGFSKGGIVETLSKVPGRNGDDGWATLKRGEAVLTPEQTKMFQNMVQVMPPFVNAMNTFTNIPSLSQAKITPNQQSISMGDLVLNLPNVTDTESFIKTIKTDTKVQKAIQQTVCDQLSGRGKLNIMKL